MTENIDPSISDRLTKIAADLFGSKAALARAAGMTPSHLWAVEKDPQRIIKLLGRIGLADDRIDLNWLLRGRSIGDISPTYKQLERENEFLKDEIRFLREEVMKRLK